MHNSLVTECAHQVLCAYAVVFSRYYKMFSLWECSSNQRSIQTETAELSLLVFLCANEYFCFRNIYDGQTLVCWSVFYNFAFQTVAKDEFVADKNA